MQSGDPRAACKEERDAGERGLPRSGAGQRGEEGCTHRISKGLTLYADHCSLGSGFLTTD